MAEPENDTLLPQDVADVKAWLEANGYRLAEVDTKLSSFFSELVWTGTFCVRVEVERGYWNLQAGRRRGELEPLHLLIPAARGAAYAEVFPAREKFAGAGVHPRGFRWVEEVPAILAWFAANDPATTDAVIARVDAEFRATW